MERERTLFEWIFAFLVLTVGGLVMWVIGVSFFTIIIGIVKFIEYIFTEYIFYILGFFFIGIPIISWIYGLFKKKEE